MGTVLVFETLDPKDSSGPVRLVPGQTLGPVVIGRGEPWSLRGAVEVEHAKLHFDGTMLRVCPMSSATTVRIGGQPVTPGTWGVVPVGGIVSIGNVQARLRASEEGTEADRRTIQVDRGALLRAAAHARRSMPPQTAAAAVSGPHMVAPHASMPPHPATAAVSGPHMAAQRASMPPHPAAGSMPPHPAAGSMPPHPAAGPTASMAPFHASSSASLPAQGKRDDVTRPVPRVSDQDEPPDEETAIAPALGAAGAPAPAPTVKALPTDPNAPGADETIAPDEAPPAEGKRLSAPARALITVAVLLILPVALIAVIMTDPNRGRPSVTPAASGPAASASVSARTDASVAAGIWIYVPPPEEGDEIAEDAEAPAETVEGPDGGVLLHVSNERALEKKAVDALAAGRYDDAAEMYAALAASTKDKVYIEAEKIARRHARSGR